MAGGGGKGDSDRMRPVRDRGRIMPARGEILRKRRISERGGGGKNVAGKINTHHNKRPWERGEGGERR